MQSAKRGPSTCCSDYSPISSHSHFQSKTDLDTDSQGAWRRKFGGKALKKSPSRIIMLRAGRKSHFVCSDRPRRVTNQKKVALKTSTVGSVYAYDPIVSSKCFSKNMCNCAFILDIWIFNKMYFLCKDWCYLVFLIVLIYLGTPICDAISLLEFFLGPSLGKSSINSKSLENIHAVSNEFTVPLTEMNIFFIIRWLQKIFCFTSFKQFWMRTRFFNENTCYNFWLDFIKGTEFIRPELKLLIYKCSVKINYKSSVLIYRVSNWKFPTLNIMMKWYVI